MPSAHGPTLQSSLQDSSNDRRFRNHSDSPICDPLVGAPRFTPSSASIPGRCFDSISRASDRPVHVVLDACAVSITDHREFFRRGDTAPMHGDSIERVVELTLLRQRRLASAGAAGWPSDHRDSAGAISHAGSRAHALAALGVRGRGSCPPSCQPRYTVVATATLAQRSQPRRA
jgi:hypothetical protein